MYRDSDVGAIEAAWRARDAAALTELGARVGIALDGPTLARLNALVSRAGTGVRRRDVIATLLDAATGETGIAVYVWERWLCLAVRHVDRVTLGFARGSKFSKVWPDLKPWQTHLPSNRKRLDPWARTEAADRVSFGVIATAKPQPKPPPNADELVRQIVDDPDNRELRAVLADLLTEHDDVRGKLMRLDREIRALPPQSEDRKKRELVVAQLVKTHGRGLAGEIAEYASGYTFAGGFVDSVTMSAAGFRDHGERLFRQQPVRRLILKPANSTAIATLARSPVALVRELRVDCPDHRRAFTFAPLRGARFERLEVLELEGMAPIDDELAFAELHAPRLRALSIRAHVHATTLRGLAANRTICDHLEELVIRPASVIDARMPDDHAIADEAFDALALPRLKHLELAGCWFATEARLARLRARAPQLTS